jgi:hypothetical protein
MKTEGNERNSGRFNLNYNEEHSYTNFIKYINALSDIIKEYYKVSINIIKNKIILINNLEQKLNPQSQEQISNNDSIKLMDIFGKLKINITSSKINLENFIQDAKIVFNEMKEYQNLNKNKIKKQNSYLQSNNKPITNRQNDLPNNIQRSEMNYKIESDPNGFYIKKNNMAFNRNNNNMGSNKAKSVIKKRENNSESLFNLNYANIQDNNIGNNKKVLEDMEKLKILNKKYILQIKKLNYELQQFKNSNNNKNQKSDDYNNIQEELILQKDKIISSLKENIEKNQKKYAQLFQSYKISQTQLKNLKDQMNLQNINIPNDPTINNKLKLLKQENHNLKLTIESLKSTGTINSKSDFNYKLNFKEPEIKNDNQNLEKEIITLKNKISLIEKRLNEEKTKNESLKNENISLINKHKMEISNLSKGNSELTEQLLKIQKELINLQKENLEKESQIESLKLSMMSAETQQKQKLFESLKSSLEKDNSIGNIKLKNISESVNKILENYKKENELLKTTKNTFMEKIKNLEIELESTKNTKIEMENKNKEQIKDLTDEFDKKISEANNKNKNISNALSSLRETYNIGVNEKQKLLEDIGAKELKIIQLQFQNNQLEEELNKLNDIKLSNAILNESNLSNLKSQCIDLNKRLKNEINTNNELKEEITKITNEKEKYKQKLLLNLGIKYNEDQEEQLNRDEIIKELNEQIEKLTNENQKLRDIIDSINYFKNSINAQNDQNEESAKKEKENLEENEQKNKKYEDEIKRLNKEIEKLTKQIVKLSTKLPEEFNELQKQYDDLQTKYKQLLKNEKKNNSNINGNINNNISNTDNNEELKKVMQELKDAKKEIEQLKKKNLELISQLEEKEIKKNYFDNKSEDANFSNYEEEFDLRKMAKGAKEKNRSQDINIDYPGIQNIKEKYRELNFYYNSMEGLVKKLLSTGIQVNPKNKTYVSELCKIVGFDMETTNKILNNKNRKLILGLFNK